MLCTAISGTFVQAELNADVIKTSCIICHVIGVCLLSQSASEKHSQEKSPETFAHLVNFSKNVSAMFDNRTILLFWLKNEQIFRMICVSCSTYYARNLGFFILITHKSMRSKNPIPLFTRVQRKRKCKHATI